jgi:hypothetical protein
MAEINELGNIVAQCPGCEGARSTFEYVVGGSVLGAVVQRHRAPFFSRDYRDSEFQYRLFRCAGCGMGAMGVIQMFEAGGDYPTRIRELHLLLPEARERLLVPDHVPEGIQNEFREAEECLEHGCYRASAAMFRSVLDKTMRANGYKTKRENLETQIDEAANDGVITQARRRRAHQDVRVLGNDVLHDDWQKLNEEDVEPAHRYIQRILEDLYDDRQSVLTLLRKVGRVPDEDRQPEQVAATDNTPATAA